jgi:hypothetical protein
MRPQARADSNIAIGRCDLRDLGDATTRLND